MTEVGEGTGIVSLMCGWLVGGEPHLDIRTSCPFVLGEETGIRRIEVCGGGDFDMERAILFGKRYYERGRLPSCMWWIRCVRIDFGAYTDYNL